MKLVMNQEAVRCRTMKGERSVVAVGTAAEFPHLVSLRAGGSELMLKALEAEKLAVLLVRAAEGKELE